jgi:hypothetical protein
VFASAPSDTPAKSAVSATAVFAQNIPLLLQRRNSLRGECVCLSTHGVDSFIVAVVVVANGAAVVLLEKERVSRKWEHGPKGRKKVIIR